MAPIMTDENMYALGFFFMGTDGVDCTFPMMWLYFPDGVDCTFPMAWNVLFRWRGLYFSDGVECTFPMAWAKNADQSRCSRAI